MDPEGQLRNLRDFLLVYNRMTEICFQRCTKNFNYRNLTMDEERCADHCAGKLIRSNHRLMGTYVQLMPTMVQRRMEELESKAAEMAKATEAGGSAEPLAGGSNPTGSHFATPTPGVLTPASAAEQAGTAASGSPVQTTPPTPNKTSGSVAHTVPVVTESAHADVTSPLLEALKDSAPSGNPSVPCGNVDVNSSMSSPASEHRSTGGERPPS